MTGPGLSSLTATATASSSGESAMIAPSDAAMSKARFQSGIRKTCTSSFLCTTGLWVNV